MTSGLFILALLVIGAIGFGTSWVAGWVRNRLEEPAAGSRSEHDPANEEGTLS